MLDPKKTFNPWDKKCETFMSSPLLDQHLVQLHFSWSNCNVVASKLPVDKFCQLSLLSRQIYPNILIDTHSLVLWYKTMLLWSTLSPFVLPSLQPPHKKHLAFPSTKPRGRIGHGTGRLVSNWAASQNITRQVKAHHPLPILSPR